MDKLTERENEVMSLVAKGFSNLEIANTLFIGINTVKTHLSKIYQKYYLTNHKDKNSCEFATLRVRAVLKYQKDLQSTLSETMEKMNKIKNLIDTLYEAQHG